MHQGPQPRASLSRIVHHVHNLRRADGVGTAWSVWQELNLVRALVLALDAVGRTRIVRMHHVHQDQIASHACAMTIAAGVVAHQCVHPCSMIALMNGVLVGGK